MFEVTFGVKAVLAKIKVVTRLAFEPRARQGVLTTAVTGDAQVEAGHELQLGQEPGPVALGGEVHGEVPAVGADAGHQAHTPVGHGAPLVLGGGHVGPNSHAVTNLWRKDKLLSFVCKMRQLLYLSCKCI